MAAAACPVCAGEGVLLRRLSAAYLADGLHRVFGEAPPAGLVPHGYGLVRCAVCGLVYADPMTPGDAAFYAWLTGFPKYHAQDRWEWAEMKRVLAAVGRPLRLLELGAGKGDLLAFLAGVPGLTARGIDLSESSVQAARARGLDVRHAALEEVLAAEAGTYDAVVLSHVLEHVERPRELMQGVMRLLAPGGRVLFSVPYSPMSREYLSDDVMNLPPHHLTRWNISALRCLARVTGMALETWMPKAKSPLKRAMKHTCDSAVGEGRVSGLARLPVLLANFRGFLRILAEHQARERVDGRMAADTILVSLRREA